MFDLPEKIVIFDTEFTAWEGSMERKWSGENEYREMVQIGAIMVETERLSEISSLLLYVRPKINPTLSEYFMNLTHITQEEVDEKGVPFKEALEKFYAWSEGFPIYCWGGDTKVLQENADLYGVENLFATTPGGNIKPLFESHGITTEGYMSSTIPRAFGEEPPPAAHDALNDARSIAQALRALARKEGVLA